MVYRSKELIHALLEKDIKKLKRKMALHRRILSATGLEWRYHVEKMKWVLMMPENDYEDLSPIYTDEPYLVYEEEVKWLKQISKSSSPQVKEAIQKQIEIMEIYREDEQAERRSMAAEIEKSRERRQLAKGDI